MTGDTHRETAEEHQSVYEDSWRLGQTLGSSVLLGQLPSEGPAEAWLARHLSPTGQRSLVIVERLPEISDPEQLRWLLSDLRLVARLDHPHLARVIEVGEGQEVSFVTREYLNGEPLSAVFQECLRRGRPIGDPLAVRLVAGAAAALHYAHTRPSIDGKPLRFVHGEVSPRNLLVTSEGQLKVLNLGLARTGARPIGRVLPFDPAYLSPEQARAHAPDAQSDVFALGVVLFELLAGGRLLPGLHDLEAVAYLAGIDPLPRVSHRRADVAHGLDVIVGKALARRREERFSSPGELHRALEEWLTETGAVAPPQAAASLVQDFFGPQLRARAEAIRALVAPEAPQPTARHLAAFAPFRATPTQVNPPSRRLRRPVIVAAALTGLALLLALLALFR